MAKLKDEIQKTEPFAVLEQEAFLNLVRTADALSRRFEEVSKGTGLSATQYNVLRILRGAGTDGLPCGQVIERMITRDPDMTRLLDRLEKRDLIARSRDTCDRRVVRGEYHGRWDSAAGDAGSAVVGNASTTAWAHEQGSAESTHRITGRGTRRLE